MVGLKHKVYSNVADTNLADDLGHEARLVAVAVEGTSYDVELRLSTVVMKRFVGSSYELFEFDVLQPVSVQAKNTSTIASMRLDRNAMTSASAIVFYTLERSS